jgi:hypothetical protein
MLQWVCTHWKKVADATKEKEEIMKKAPANKQKTERNRDCIKKSGDFLF